MAPVPEPRPSPARNTSTTSSSNVLPSVNQVVILGAWIRHPTLPSQGPVLPTRSSRNPPPRHPRRSRSLRAAPPSRNRQNPTSSSCPSTSRPDDLAACAKKRGRHVSGNQPTLFLWEGVTQYLSAEAVDKTLAVVHRLAGAGGHLMFTYVDSGVIGHHAAQFPEAAKWLRGVDRRGEPWVFGISPPKLSAYLAARLSPRRRSVHCRRWHPGLRPLGRRERGSGLYRIATVGIDATTVVHDGAQRNPGGGDGI